MAKGKLPPALAAYNAKKGKKAGKKSAPFGGKKAPPFKKKGA